MSRMCQVANAAFNALATPTENFQILGFASLLPLATPLYPFGNP